MIFGIAAYFVTVLTGLVFWAGRRRREVEPVDRVDYDGLKHYLDNEWDKDEVA